MPQVIPWIAKAAFWVASGTTGKFLAFIFKLGVSMAASYAINKLLAPKLPKDSLGGNPLQMGRNPVAARRVIYGTGRYSGPIVFANVSSGSGTITFLDGRVRVSGKNERLHFLVALAGHECEEIGPTFWFDDKQFEVPYPINGTSHAEYGPVLLLNKHRGAAGETADANLLADIPTVWTTDHKLEGIAYVMVRLYWDPKVFPGGIPNVTAMVKGKKCYDPRDTVTRWTQNPALCLRDYLTDTVYGMGVDSDSVDDASFIAAANICDESVAVATSFTRSGDVTSGDREIVCADTSGMFPGLAVAGTGIAAGSLIASVDVAGAYFMVDRDPTATSTGVTLSFGDAEPRYTMNGSFETDVQPATVIEYILGTMAGSLVFVGGQWRVKAGAYETPTITLDESDMRGPISVQTKDSIADACNGVKGTFANPVEDYQFTDFAAVQDAGYLAEDDDVEMWRDVTMPFVTSHSQAQRLAKIELVRSRFDITAQLSCKLTAIRVQAGDTVAVTNARLGWTAKPLLVTSFACALADDGTVGCDLTVRETDPSVYDWTATGEDGEEEPYTPSPDSDSPDFPEDPDPEYPDLFFLLLTPGLECRSRGGTATLQGHSEYTTPSTPPKKYLVETLSGETCFQRHNPNATLCAGAPYDATRTVYSGTDVVDPADGVHTITKIKTNYVGPNTSATKTCATAPYASTTAGDVWGTLDETTPTRKHYDATDPCHFVDSIFGGLDYVWSGDTELNLSEEDTEQAAVDRLVATLDWPQDEGVDVWYSSGSIGCGGELCCTAYWQDRTTGFSVAYQEAQGKVSVPTLGSLGLYYVEVDIYRRPYGSSDPDAWVLVETLKFSENADVGGLLEFEFDVPNERGWETKASTARVYE